MPYIDITLSIRKQLEYLSAAMHIALDLYIHNPTAGSFLPNLLYADLAIMVKNVYFSVAKTKVLDPNSSLYIILLGTDRLETLFGILRTMVGNDTNADMLQLSTRLGHVNECANILARYPQWDRSPRRLRLPTRDGLHKGSHEVDHVNVASWKGDVSVKNVVLLTCWNAGLEVAADGDRALMERMQDLRSRPTVDILSPFGSLMVKLDGIPEDDDMLQSALIMHETSVIAEEDESAASLDVEDAAGLLLMASGTRQNDPFIHVDGKKVHKATALKSLFMHMSHEGSTDRTQRVAGLDKYSIDTTYPNIYQSDLDASPENHVQIQDPAVTLIRCDGYTFLAVIMVSGIKKGNTVITHIPTAVLGEDDVAISCQILSMQPHDVRDGDEVWMWDRKYELKSLVISGGLVHPVNPVLVTREALEPVYEFTKSELQGLSAALFSKLDSNGLKNLPQVKMTDTYPYRSRGKLSHIAVIESLKRYNFDRKYVVDNKACFMCDLGSEAQHLEDLDGRDGTARCLRCGSILDLSNIPKLLEHAGATSCMIHVLTPAIPPVDFACAQLHSVQCTSESRVEATRSTSNVPNARSSNNILGSSMPLHLAAQNPHRAPTFPFLVAHVHPAWWAPAISCGGTI